MMYMSDKFLERSHLRKLDREKGSLNPRSYHMMRHIHSTMRDIGGYNDLSVKECILAPRERESWTRIWS